MKTPNDVVRGRIIDIDPRGWLTIRAYYDDWPTLIKRGYNDVFVQMVDSRPVSRKQQNACYKLLREIADYSGSSIDAIKDTLKKKYLEEELQSEMIDDFSLSDSPVSLVAGFQRWLIRFMVENDIPSSFRLLDMVEDMGDYLYACLLSRKCCICGRYSDIHHVESVGIGRDREEIVHEGMEVLPLCRRHHNEAHKIGKYGFEAKYHIDRGVVLDAYLCDVYGLRKEDDLYVESSDNAGEIDEGP